MFQHCPGRVGDDFTMMWEIFYKNFVQDCSSHFLRKCIKATHHHFLVRYKSSHFLTSTCFIGDSFLLVFLLHISCTEYSSVMKVLCVWDTHYEITFNNVSLEFCD